MEAAQKEQQVNDLRVRFMNGEDAAGDELARLSFDDFSKVDESTRKRAAEEAAILGNASLGLLNLPYEQRRDQFIAIAQQLPQFADKIQEVMFLPQNEQDAALTTVVAEAKLMDKLININRPDYQRLAPGEVLVNTKDPAAVSQFGAGQQGYSEGQTAFNPQTGQKIVYRNGAWRPM